MTETSLLDQITMRIRAEGGRMTSQRRLILEALQDSSDHPTAEEIYEKASCNDSSLNLSTVYRTLRWLEEEGFVSTRWFEDERRQERFDPISADNPDHNHFRCRVCNTIIEFPEPLIDVIKSGFQQAFGGRVETTTLTLYGICQACLEKE